MTSYADTQYSSKMIASDRSNYWRYYGLHRDPFMPIVEDNNFFLPTHWEQYFDLLQYLCESTNVLLNVVGAKGSGKTTFMRQFIAQASDNAQICRLVGSAVLTSAQLSQTLIKDFNLPKPAGETNEEQWESLCLSLQAGAQPYLLVIDDAHRLPQETFKNILNLIKQQSEHQMRLHVLLIGEIQSANILNALKEGESEGELTHTITLEPLSLQDTEAYIKHRLLAAGLPGGMPLRTSDIARIYKLSEGVPGRINAVVRQVLIDIMRQRQLYGFAHFIRTRRTQFLGGAVILIILIALAAILTRGTHDPALRLYKLLVSQKITPPATDNLVTNDKTMVMPTANINKSGPQTRAPVATVQQSSKTKPEKISANSNRALLTTANISSAATIPVDSVKINTGENSSAKSQWFASGMFEFKSQSLTDKKNTARAIENKSTTNLAANNMPASPITNNNETAAKTTAIRTSATTLPTQSQQAVTAKPMSALAQTNEPKTVAPIATIQQTLTAATATSNKLLTLDSPFLSNAKHYTLQLIGASSEAAVNSFIAKNQLGDQAYYYRTKFRDKNWYVVVYGDYPTRQAAENALNTLQESVQNIQPWSRTMASVRVSIGHGLAEQTASQANMEQQAAITETAATKPVTAAVTSKKTKGTTTKSTQEDSIDIPLID